MHASTLPAGPAWPSSSGHHAELVAQGHGVSPAQLLRGDPLSPEGPPRLTLWRGGAAHAARLTGEPQSTAFALSEDGRTLHLWPQFKQGQLQLERELGGLSGGAERLAQALEASGLESLRLRAGVMRLTLLALSLGPSGGAAGPGMLRAVLSGSGSTEASVVWRALGLHDLAHAARAGRPGVSQRRRWTRAAAAAAQHSPGFTVGAQVAERAGSAATFTISRAGLTALADLQEPAEVELRAGGTHATYRAWRAGPLVRLQGPLERSDAPPPQLQARPIDVIVDLLSLTADEHEHKRAELRLTVELMDVLMSAALKKDSIRIDPL